MRAMRTQRLLVHFVSLPVTPARCLFDACAVEDEPIEEQDDSSSTLANGSLTYFNACRVRSRSYRCTSGGAIDAG